MRIKKSLSVTMLVLSFVLLLFAFTACGKEHEHAFSEWETTSEPTCTSIGLKKRDCDCGQVEYDTIAALSHTPVTDEEVPATCTTLGKTEGSHCSTCGVIITAQNAVAPTGHACEDVTILEEAFCNHDGVKQFSCVNPGCSYSYEESYSIPALDGEVIHANAMQYVGVLRSYNRWKDDYGGYEEAPAFVISADGKIVTSSSKIDNICSPVFVLGGNEYEVTEVLACDTMLGIAVLQVDATDLPCATLCTSEPVNAEGIYMVGFPGGFTDTMTSGIISNADFQIEGGHYILHDAVMMKGYSGGPLINRYGEVIGLNLGYLIDTDVSIAVRISELASLDYTNPMSAEDYGKMTYKPEEQLSDWVNANYIATNNNAIAYALQGSGFYYSLGYDTADEYSFSEGYWRPEGSYELYVRIIFNNSEGTYQYYATFTDGMKKNEVYGFLDAATYTKETILTYDTYYGRYWTEAELMALYSTAVYDTLEFFSHCLDTYFDTLTLESFGFSALSYERDENALEKLNAYVMNNGLLNEETGGYTFTVSSAVNGDSEIFGLSYTPASEDTAASTVVTINYYTANGDLFCASLSLDSTENGNRFDFVYAIYDGSEYVAQNVAWGYLDVNSLTNATIPTCYVFDGMNEYEDGLLTDYVALLSHLMAWLDGVMTNVSPELSIKDLGFYFYFSQWK